MDVLLISLNREAEPFTAAPLGMALVAGSLVGAGHRVRSVDLLFSDDPRAEIIQSFDGFRPGLVGISIRNIESSTEFLLPSYRDAVSVIKSVSDAPIAAGGPGFSILPEQALSYLGLELGIAGEGERAILELVSALETGQDPSGVPGVCVLRAGVFAHTPSALLEGPDLVQGPSWDGLPMTGYDMVGVQSKRGCSFNCIYCTYPSLEGRRLRLREPSLVAAEMEASSSAGASAFYFVDNVFNNPPSHARAVCDAIKARGIDLSWGALVSPNGLDGGLVDAMAGSGCGSVEIGADSLSDRMLKNLGKSFRAADVRSAVSTCKITGLMHMVFLILGGPGEDYDTLMETFDAVDSLSPDKVFAVSGVRVYPGTPLARIAEAEGVIGPDDPLLMPVFYTSDRLGDRLYTLSEEFFGAHPGWLYYPAKGVTGDKPKQQAGLSWGADAMDCFEKVMVCVPLLLRPIARKAVHRKAGSLALERGRASVTTAEVRDAFLSETPAPFKAGMRESLKGLGLIDG